MKSLKEVTGQIVSVVTVNDFLSVVGEKSFNDYLISEHDSLLFQQSEILVWNE
jgi:hypothetical protein